MWNYEFEAITLTIQSVLFQKGERDQSKWKDRVTEDIPEWTLFEFPNSEGEHEFIQAALSTAVTSNACSDWSQRYKTRMVDVGGGRIMPVPMPRSGWYSPPSEFDFLLEHRLLDYWSITYLGDEDEQTV